MTEGSEGGLVCRREGWVQILSVCCAVCALHRGIQVRGGGASACSIFQLMCPGTGLHPSGFASHHPEGNLFEFVPLEQVLRCNFTEPSHMIAVVLTELL